MNKHEHVVGRPRDYISLKWRYKGKHRGEYCPNPHWVHVSCDPNGFCLYSIKTVILRPYIDPYGRPLV